MTAIEKNLLLVDDEQNILASLRRLFRRDGYNIFTAASGPEGLSILQTQDIGVIVSDQRMPEMVGSDFLERAKKIRPDTIRMILSGYTELASVADAINRGAVFKFLTKPWDDELLREHVGQAFAQYEMAAENARLNAELKSNNSALASMVQELEMRAAHRGGDGLRLPIERDILDSLPLGVIGVADNGLILAANQKASSLLGGGALAGCNADRVLPSDLLPRDHAPERGVVELAGGKAEVRIARLRAMPGTEGWIVMLDPR